MTTMTEIKASTWAATSDTTSKAVTNAVVAALGGAAKKSEGRPVLAMALIQCDGERIEIITTSSYRANRVSWPVLDKVEPFRIQVDAEALKTSLPKPSTFKPDGQALLQFGWYPGERELDAGQFHVCWANEQRIMVAHQAKVGATTGDYPNVESLLQGTIDDKVITNEPTCWNPKFLGEIAKEAKLIHKERYVKLTPGSSPMKPGMFTTRNDEGILYECLLMPVRES